MVKKIKNPIATVVTEANGGHSVRADYGVVSEGVEERRSMEITLTPGTINDIHEEVIAQIHAHEGTTEVVDGEE